MRKIHQLVAGFRSGDAISSEALLFERLLSEHGIEAPIYCPASNIASKDRALAHPLADLADRVGADDVALLHLSIGSECNSVFRSLPCRKVILYHNVTPAHFFSMISPATAQVLDDGRRDVAMLRDAADSVFADSAFNARELVQMGYRDPKVLPLAIDEAYGQQKPDPAMMAKLGDGLVNILFVGRMAPNKRHDSLLKAFSHYQNLLEPHSRLVIAGGYGPPVYDTTIRAMAIELKLRNVYFTRFISDAELAACYASASAFVCLSEHEGFCAPLLEAMAWHVPVFANDAGAIAETLDGAGVLLTNASHHVVAEAVHKVVSDEQLRVAVVKHQDERLARFRARDVWAELSAALGI